MRFIAFDLETTGFLAGIEQIVEVGAVRFVDGEVDAIFSTLVNPGKHIPEGASQVNRIFDDMVQDKPTIDTLLEPFADFCGDDIIVAHNAPFDVQFLSEDIKKFESRAPRGVILDTCAMARKVFPGLPNHKLGTLVQHLGIPTTNFHRAEEDATYCGLLFAAIVSKITDTGMPPIENLIALTGRPELRFPQIVRQPKQLDLLF
jgi:DNA polymerase-3 subunit epsilon